MYHQINGAETEVASAAMICRAGENTNAVMFDVMGPPSRVMAVTSFFLEHGKIGCQDMDGYAYHGREKMLHYTRDVQPVPRNPKMLQASDTWVHSIVMLKIFGEIDHEQMSDWFPSPTSVRFGILLEDGQDVIMSFYLRLRKFVEKTPLSADWREWLWQEFQAKSWIQSCTTCFGTWHAWIVQFQEQELASMISAAIKARVPEIVSIFGEG